MENIRKKLDVILLVLLITVVVGLPLGIRAYDKHMGDQQKISGAKEFTLTGNARYGWLLGDIKAHDIATFDQNTKKAMLPVIHVKKGDNVVLKIRSSDVEHGFSLKAFDIYIPDGIKPGKTAFASLTANKTGTFIFACNVYCGDIHQHMTGKLIVTD